ncbi:MAG: N-acetyltransferase family protein [Bacteroidota bacterium]
MEVVVRNAETKDVDRILEIVNHEILNSTVIYEYKERTLTQQLEWFEQKQANGFPVIVAEYGGRVVGFGTYGTFRARPAYQFTVEHSVYVSHEFRANGVGKQLLTKLIELAKENGFHVMIAGVDSSNQQSFEFHKKFGFEEVGTFKEVGYKFDKWLDIRFLQLTLD